ncbi:WD40-repeat-containing domain protein [Mycena leptocephala]|nr:WD40-repeat-containing domain protein [Mycena leptocephala]
MDSSTAYSWVPPEFNLFKPPSCSEKWPVTSDASLLGNFARSAKWCPDGSVALVQCEHREFQILPPTSSAYSSSSNPLNTEPFLRTLPQSAPILDYVWYPTASIANPASFCFVASVRETPVKLLDASDGRLRASYPIVDHRERQIAPHSLAFNLSATKLYCGFEDAIEVFDVTRPGEGTRLPTSPSKKSRDGLKGIISALAFSPSYESDLYAAGSLASTTGNIALFTETDGAIPVRFLHFNPMRPHILYATFRRRRAVYGWDLRADVGAPVVVYSPTDSVSDPLVGDTNQKRRFDVDITGRLLGVGNQEGNISIFDLPGEAGEAVSVLDTPTVKPCLTWSAHQDAIGAVSFHPTRPALLSVSGSRHFHTREAEDCTDSSSDDDEEDPEILRNVRRSVTRPTPVPLDASMKLWVFE